jgi:cell division protein FtsI (penicillin-binding protein 3)
MKPRGSQPPSTAVGRQTAEDKARLTNRATNGTYELGSLFKVVSIAAAIDSGQVSLKDTFDATQPLRIKGARIDDVHAKRRWLSVPECFMYSSNICTAKVALKAGGGQILEPFFRKVGFYEKPDIQLPQAELGRPQVPHRWSDVVSATTSFGHGIAVSPFQYVDAVAGIVRDAPWVKPTLLRRAPEAPLPTRPAPVGRLTSRDMRWMMWLTVEKGTGKSAQEPAYLLGGKTGTADKPKEHGRGYQKGAVLASFAGVFPIEAPRYVVVALIDEPRANASTGNTRYGGAVSAPIVGKIVDRIGPLLSVTPSEVAAKDPFVERLVVTKGPGRWEERVAALPAPR